VRDDDIRETGDHPVTTGQAEVPETTPTTHSQTSHRWTNPDHLHTDTWLVSHIATSTDTDCLLTATEINTPNDDWLSLPFYNITALYKQYKHTVRSHNCVCLSVCLSVTLWLTLAITTSSLHIWQPTTPEDKDIVSYSYRMNQEVTYITHQTN